MIDLTTLHAATGICTTVYSDQISKEKVSSSGNQFRRATQWNREKLFLTILRVYYRRVVETRTLHFAQLTTA